MGTLQARNAETGAAFLQQRARERFRQAFFGFLVLSASVLLALLLHKAYQSVTTAGAEPQAGLSDP